MAQSGHVFIITWDDVMRKSGIESPPPPVEDDAAFSGCLRWGRRDVTYDIMDDAEVESWRVRLCLDTNTLPRLWIEAIGWRKRTSSLRR